MKTTDNSRTVQVFKGSSWEAELVKGLLIDNGIAAMTKDGAMASIAPYIVPDVTVLVYEEERERALRIIEEREKPEL